MPGYKGHLAGGVVIYFIAFYVMTFYIAPTFLTGLEWLLFTLAGALFPDVDVKSRGQNYFYWIVLCLLILLITLHRWKIVALTSILATIPLLVRHRGIFHRAWFVVMIPLTAAGVLSSYVPQHSMRMWIDALFFTVGALSHLWLDLGLRKMFRW